VALLQPLLWEYFFTGGKMEPNFQKANEFFASLDASKIKDYSAYWETLRPKNPSEVFQRYLFAFCSVHTTFAGNISGYNAIKDYSVWKDDRARLLQLLTTAKCGLQNGRTENIWNFAEQFWANSSEYQLPRRRHLATRNEITDKIRGLGIAKVAFALELTEPNGARVLCGDIHQLRLYGIPTCKYNSVAERTAYHRMEIHWLRKCAASKVPPYIARCLFWDELQGHPDSRYWSHVFEG
jgi:hypothetical protein